MTKVIREELQRTLRAQPSHYLKCVKINDVSIFYHVADVRSEVVLFKLRLKLTDENSILYTVAVVFYDDMHSIEIVGRSPYE